MSAAFSRWLRGVGRVAQRRLGGPKTWVRKFFDSEMMRWERQIVARGVAIGMFWAWIPMPFQMVPAALLCWLLRSNLPLAIACVWISNPLTYLPIFALEYGIGRRILGMPGPEELPLGEDADSAGLLMEIVGHARDIGVPVLTGALTLSVSTALLGYLVIALVWKDRLKAAHRRSAAGDGGA